jgi:tripartite-type tricarboxylate transporter receptor subunit TctC
MSFRTALLGTTAFMLAAIGFGSGVHAADPGYPVRAIRMIVPFPSGGGADLTARIAAHGMGEALRRSIVVDNRPGANGILGTEIAARSAADGYTLLLVDRGALGINPSLYRKLPYDPLRDFQPIAIATEAPYVFVANPALQVGTIAELVARARSRPGSMSYGSYGVGSMAHINFEAFNRRHGIDLQHVAYKGAPAAVSAVVGGEIAVTMASAPSVLGFVRDGRLRALAVGAPERMALLPDVPTMAEVGGGADTLIPTFFALAAPAGTSHSIVATLHSALKRAIDSTDATEKLVANGLVPNVTSPEVMRSTVSADVSRFRALVSAIGIKPE